MQVKIYRNFKETASLKPGFNVEEIYGGALLGVRGTDFICFYDWLTAKVGRPSKPVRVLICR